MITTTPFRQFPADQDHAEHAEAWARCSRPDGSTVTAKIQLFMLEDGRIGVGVYPSAERGTVLRWDEGPDADPRVIFWEAPRLIDSTQERHPGDETALLCDDER